MRGKKPRVVVFYGGDAPNFDLSSETGRWICQYLPRDTYDVVPVHVMEDGMWKVPLGNLPTSGPVGRTLEMLSQAIQPLPPTQAIERLLTKPVDSIITAVRGRGGDDGAMHSLGSALHIPVVGSPQHASQITSNKHLFSQIIGDAADVPYGYRFKATDDNVRLLDSIREQFMPPVFIKPIMSEGSAGIEYVASPDELTAALARNQNTDILLQEVRPGTELAFTLVEDEMGKVRALPPVIIEPQKAPFYDALAKRRPGHVRLTALRDMNDPVVAEAEAIARNVYDELGCRGMVTLDMIANDGSIDVLEANTIPTLSTMTPLTHQLKAAGLHPTTLFDMLIQRSWRDF